MEEVRHQKGRRGFIPGYKKIEGTGMKKGQKTKAHREKIQLRQMILEALDEAGGVNYLLQLAYSNSSAFCALVAKILPSELEVSGTINVQLGARLDEARKAIDQENQGDSEKLAEIIEKAPPTPQRHYIERKLLPAIIDVEEITDQ